MLKLLMVFLIWIAELEMSPSPFHPGIKKSLGLKVDERKSISVCTENEFSKAFASCECISHLEALKPSREFNFYSLKAPKLIN